ncbi:MAG: acyltransferase, partial [Proteobacteria bacterium]|nr:acyltransferase [Pseudomonadota bacterium]
MNPNSSPLDHSGAPASGYRPDIDGLRALAVLLVIVFHAFPKSLPSGFIGVDVFFVISGYLISSIIAGGLKSGRFTFTDFYSKRVLRIFPALLFVLLFVVGFSWFTLVSGEFEVLGKHVFAASTFTSNFFLWNEAGYFDQSSELKPLLHLWSLAIEEQFYLVYPLFLWWWHRKGYRFSRAVILVGVLSMGVNLGLAGTRPYADFYMPLSRFWELMFGAWIADRDMKGLTGSSKSSNAWSLAGFFL